MRGRPVDEFVLIVRSLMRSLSYSGKDVSPLTKAHSPSTGFAASLKSMPNGWRTVFIAPYLSKRRVS